MPSFPGGSKAGDEAIVPRSTNVGRSVFCCTMTRTPLASVNVDRRERAARGRRRAHRFGDPRRLDDRSVRNAFGEVVARGGVALLRVALRRAVVRAQMADDGRAALRYVRAAASRSARGQRREPAVFVGNLFADDAVRVAREVADAVDRVGGVQALGDRQALGGGHEVGIETGFEHGSSVA